ncbi:MAG: hypothetical protein KAJ51_01050 [Thermoplasmata archaeon]|nr:hypothetical protein [Thermoplasmata archaeon]
MSSETKSLSKKDSIAKYRSSINRNYNNFIATLSYLKNLADYPEFEYLELISREEIKKWERTLEHLETKKVLVEATGKLKDWENFSYEFEQIFYQLYQHNIKVYIKILRYKLEDIYQYLRVQENGDLLAIQSFHLPGTQDVMAIYDLKGEAMKLIYNKLDDFEKSIDNLNKDNIKVFNNFLEKIRFFMSEFRYYETDGLNRNILFNFINELYNIIPASGKAEVR